MQYEMQLETPLGLFIMQEEQGAITRAYFIDEKASVYHQDQTELLCTAAKQVQEYFSKQRQEFNLPLRPFGTPYQKQVWDLVSKIPYGNVQSYGQIARQLQQPKGARAVGKANHDNPILLFIPCHRIISSSGQLQGYSGGLQRKQYLLDWEREAYEYTR